MHTRIAGFSGLGVGRLVVWAMALVAAALLSACGGGGGDSGGSLPPAEAPRLEIRSDDASPVSSTFAVDFYFSAPVRLPHPSGELQFSLSGASKVPDSFIKVNPQHYRMRLTPNVASQGLIDLRVPPEAFQDASGTAYNKVAYEFSRAFDTTGPFAEFAFSGPVDTLGRILGPGVFTVQFNMVLDAPMNANVLKFTAGQMSGFTKTSAAGQPDTYTFTYTPPAATRGGLTIEMPKASVTSGGIPNLFNWWTYFLVIP